MALMTGSHSLLIFLIFAVASLALDPVTAKVDWRTCGKSLPKECGEAIGRRVNWNKRSTVSDDCCVALVKIGKPCHDAFTQEHVRSHAHKGRTYLVVKRSAEIWDECTEVVKFVFPPTEAPHSS